MSAEALALAVRAADAYARVRGRWSPLCRTIVIESDAIQPWRCSVRESPRSAGTLLFDPFPRKEKTLPTPPSQGARPNGLDPHFHANITAAVPLRLHTNHERGGVAPSAVVSIGDGVDLSIWDQAAAFALAEILRDAVEFFDRLAVEAGS